MANFLPPIGPYPIIKYHFWDSKLMFTGLCLLRGRVRSVLYLLNEEAMKSVPIGTQMNPR